MSGFIICSNCNAKMPAGAKFCTKCGAQLNDAAVWSSEEAKDKDTAAETSAGSLNEAPAASGKTSPGSKKKLFIGIGIAAAAAAVVIALVAGFSMGNKSSENGGGAVATSGAKSTQSSGSSEVKKEGPKYSDLSPQTFDLFAEKTLPNAKAEGMSWDNTLFYWLEDVYTDKDDDGNIASCKIMTTMLKDTGTGEIYRYVVYKDKSNGKIYKIVSMRDTAQGMEVIDYYYKEGVPDFMFVRTESVYTPTYATPDKVGKRYYFNNNVLVRERTIDIPQQIQEKVLTREETWYDRVCYFDLPDAEKAAYDATEKNVLNMAINTYNAILNSKAIGQVYGSVKNTAGQPAPDTDIRIKQASGNEWLYQAATGSDGTFSFYVYLEDVDCVMDFIPSDTAYKKSVVGSLSLTQSTLLYNVDVILHKAAGDTYAVTLNVIDAEKSLTDDKGSYNEKAAGGVEVTFREGYNVRTGASAAEGKSDAEGNVKVDLSPGTYTVEIKGAGYITTYVIIEVEDKAVTEKAYLVSTAASGTTTVLLTWDDNSRDLDLTAFTTEQAEGGDMARIGGGRMKDDMGNILLSDNARGCEVIHLSTSKAGAYRIYVNDFTNSSNGRFSSDDLSRMNLKVYIFCDGNVYVYTFPAGRSGVVWEVAQVNGNTVTSVQQVSSNIEQGSMWTKKWEDDTWKKVYIDAINNNVIYNTLIQNYSSPLDAQEKKIVLDEYTEQSSSDRCSLNYWMYDVDRDGIPELAVNEIADTPITGGLFTVTHDNEFKVLRAVGDHVYLSELQGIVLCHGMLFTGYLKDDSYVDVCQFENGEFKVVDHCEFRAVQNDQHRKELSNFIDGYRMVDGRSHCYCTKSEIIEAIKAYKQDTLTPTSESQKPGQQQTDNSSVDYILPTSNSQYLDRAVIAALSAENLRLARNEIYARHGRKFNAEDLQAYFNSKTWYKPTIEAVDFDTNGGNLLNDFEKVNLETMQQVETEREQKR